jgi:hypothetical protein
MEMACVAMGCLATIYGLGLAGKCHGDVKPSNILLAANQVTKEVYGLCAASCQSSLLSQSVSSWRSIISLVGNQRAN